MNMDIDNIHVVYSLRKLSYISCTKEEQYFYNDLSTLEVDVKPCCTAILDFIKTGMDPSKNEILNAAAGREWLSTPVTVCEKAARHGHVECLRLSRTLGFQWTESVCEQAASNGHAECLRYAHRHGCPWNAFACYMAAANGHVACLRYARENGCPWDVSVCRNAAWFGRFDCLRYAREHGCPLDESVSLISLTRGHRRCYEYARSVTDDVLAAAR